jgi:hypothetical protein
VCTQNPSLPEISNGMVFGWDCACLGGIVPGNKQMGGYVGGT